jgi:hypothetical protein
MNFIKQLWLSVRSNPYFVAFEGGASGAALSFINDALQQGHLDFTTAGLQRLFIVAITGGVTALRLLYRTPPGANPNQ